jgi:phosphoribosylanthranilate isomerase
VWKAIRPRTPDEFLAGVSLYENAVDGLLVDGWSASALGGTGAPAPWTMLRPLRERVPAHVRLILAGGLTAGNAAEAIDAVRPDGVDVSSGVERVVGEKSAERIRAFVAAARSARDSGIEA